MVGEAAAGVLAPAGGVLDRYPRVQITDKTADRKGKRLDRPILVIVGHSELGADGGQQYLPQLRYLQHLVGSRNIELTYDIREDVVRLGGKRDSNIKVPVQHHVICQVVLKLSHALQQMRCSYSAGKRVLDEVRTRFGERAKCRKHGESAQAVAKKGRWSVQPVNHFRQQTLDKSVQVIDGCFIDTGSASRRLDRHQLHGVVEQLRPSPKRYNAAARIGKTEQTDFGSRIGPRRDQPFSDAAQRDVCGRARERCTELLCTTTTVAFPGERRLFIRSNGPASIRVISISGSSYCGLVGCSTIGDSLQFQPALILICRNSDFPWQNLFSPHLGRGLSILRRRSDGRLSRDNRH